MIGIGALIVAGCGGDDAPEASTQVELLGTDDLAFEPDTFAVPVGEEVTIDLTAEDEVDHDLVIEGAAEHGMASGAAGHDDEGDDHDDEGDGHDDEGEDDHSEDHDETAEADLHVAHVEPGSSLTATFMIEEAGSYTFYCSVPGHREAGMEGELTVTEG